MSKKIKYLKKIAEALDRLSPVSNGEAIDFEQTYAFTWKPNLGILEPVAYFNNVNIKLLVGIENIQKILMSNTEQFVKGFAANNALLWGARGMGKSSLVKAVHLEFVDSGLKLVEIKREDLNSLDLLINKLRDEKFRFILFCDDLSFSEDDTDYKSMKALLDGSIESRPNNIIFYATSNRRHLMPRKMSENENATAINPAESIDEKVSLSDRFGLWLGFYPCDQDQYLKMVQQYSLALNIPIEQKKLFSQAIEWQQTRGSRSGRVAWQFVTDLAGKNGIKIESLHRRDF